MSGSSRSGCLSQRHLSYEDAEREAIQLEAYEADHRAEIERQDAKHWRAGRAQGALARTSPLNAERRDYWSGEHSRKKA
jgi:hypothetical protein